MKNKSKRKQWSKPTVFKLALESIAGKATSTPIEKKGCHVGSMIITPYSKASTGTIGDPCGVAYGSFIAVGTINTGGPS